MPYITDASGNYVPTPTIQGADGKEVTLRVSNGYIQWKREDTDWAKNSFNTSTSSCATCMYGVVTGRQTSRSLGLRGAIPRLVMRNEVLYSGKNNCLTEQRIYAPLTALDLSLGGCRTMATYLQSRTAICFMLVAPLFR